MKLNATTRGLLLALSTATFVTFPITSHADDSLNMVPANAAENTNLWFVELADKPLIAGNNAQQLKSAKQAFKKAAADAGVKYKERMAFDTLFNGYSIEISPSERAKLSQIQGVKAIYPVEVIQAPEESLSPAAIADMSTALNMTGANIAQSSLGLSGEGIKVAVMDTGIDIDHPDFGGNGANGSTAFPTPRVAYGYDLVGDAFNADSSSPSYNPVPTPDANPDDCGGHGTHVAGIIGADGVVKGVAPKVTFGAYRVFGCQGSTTADVMIAAMEKAYADGMQVLNMSIGSSFQWPQYPTAQAASRLVEKGMVVVASIGNSGTSGLYAAGAPGLGDNVIGVASYDNSHLTMPYATYNAQKIAYLPMTYSPAIPTAGSTELLYVGEACAALPAGSLVGKSALIARGTCSFSIKAINAIAAGADSVVVYNNTAGPVSGTLGAPLANPRPVVGISQADGQLLRSQAAPVMLNWTPNSDRFAVPTGGLISSFSSYGLSPDLQLKPDLGAPGGNIYSTYPLESGGFATLSGTSMSSPHVAGAVALLLQAKPGTPAMQVRDILQNSADPKNWSGSPSLGFLDMVHRQGAGMLDIDDSIQATTLITPGKLSLGEGEAGPTTHTLTLRNNSVVDQHFAMSATQALSTGGIVTPSFSTSNASVGFSQTMLTVPAGGTASVDVTVTPATGPQYGMYGGYVKFTSQDGGQNYSVPYAGFVGDYQSIQAVTPTAYNFPWLAKLANGSYSKCTDSCSFSMQGSDVPFFLAHFEHQAQAMEMEVLNAGSLTPVHPVFYKTNVDHFIPRNSTATGFFTFAWDGTRLHNNGGKGMTKVVPNGDYVLRLKVLKANGDASNPAHWEVWESPTITVKRP